MSNLPFEVFQLFEFFWAYPLMVIGFFLGFYFKGNNAGFAEPLFGALYGLIIQWLLKKFLYWRRLRVGSRPVYIDRESKRNTLRSSPFDYRESDQELFLRCLFSMFAKVAQADGAVTQHEIDECEKTMREVLCLDAKTRRRAIDIFRRSLHSQVTIQSLCEELTARFYHRPSLLERIIDELLQLAFSDGVFSVEEELLISETARRLQIGAGRYEELKAGFLDSKDRVPPLNSEERTAYEILGCTPNSTSDEIRKQFKILAKKFHPDRYKGDKKEAAQLFVKIKGAYDYIRISRNIT